MVDGLGKTELGVVDKKQYRKHEFARVKDAFSFFFDLKDAIRTVGTPSLFTII